MTPPRARVTVVDDHSLFAESLVIALVAEGIDARCVVPEDETPLGRLGRAVLQTKPDIVLLDLDLGARGDGMPLVAALTAAGIRVVVVTGTSDQARWGEALSHGARSVLAKETTFTEIVGTIRRVAGGLAVISRERRIELVAAWNTTTTAEREVRSRFEQLTRREAAVLSQLMAGMQVGEIARQRFVSESTVRTQVKSLLAKLQVNSQLTAVGLAHKVHWRPPAHPAAGGGVAGVPITSEARPPGGRRAPWASTA